MLETIIATGLIVFVLILLAYKLDKKHFIIKFFFILMALTLLILIPKATLDTKCELVLAYSRETYRYGQNFSGYHWDYVDPIEFNPAADAAFLFHRNTTNIYQEKCYNLTDSTTGTTLFKNYTRIYWLVWVYVIFYFMFEVLKYMGLIGFKRRK